jgi:ubiquinone/menaquinone biosynthesis C-methylase UbiE
VKGRARAKQRAKPDKKQLARRAQRERQALQNLAEKRRPFEPLLEQIVAAVLHAEAPVARCDRSNVAPDGPRRAEAWVEVGSGLGQLRSLLPAEVRPHVTHTDLSGSLIRALTERHPKARAVAANVTHLPFESESVDVVLGLCAFDSFSSPAQASREIGRVLRPGGRFIHFLDAATNVEPVVTELIGRARLPLPNFFADIALRHPQLLDASQRERFLHDYHDVLSVPVSHFVAILEMLRRAGHPLAPMLDRYSAPFLKRPFEVLPAARTLVKLTSDPTTGRPMNQALMSLFTALQQAPYLDQLPFDLQSHSSLAHFKARLEHYFGVDYGYALRMSTVVYARVYEIDHESPLRARIRRVGIGQNCVDWPAPQGVLAQQLKRDLPSVETAEVTPESHVLREAAVYCLVSERKLVA